MSKESNGTRHYLAGYEDGLKARYEDCSSCGDNYRQGCRAGLVGGTIVMATIELVVLAVFLLAK